MRQIGVAERALELMCERVKSREAFGKPLAEQGVIMEWIADSRMEIEQARLLTLKAAHMMDTVGNKEARSEIAQIKVVAPNATLRVLDRAIQAFRRGRRLRRLPARQLLGCLPHPAPRRRPRRGPPRGRGQLELKKERKDTLVTEEVKGG
jgi:acyl-CoA dehydrogenase